jgi:hypothetical protein
MQGFYRAILRLYPTEYQVAFAPEMIQVFNQASVDFRKRGLLRLISFVAYEFTGLVKGMVSEHVAKWTAHDAYITSRSLPRRNTGIPAEIAQIQTRLEYALRSMESAIANHDFPKARRYSNEERVVRELLQKSLEIPNECS